MPSSPRPTKRSNSILGIWASSSPAKSVEFRRGLKILKQWEIETIIPRDVEKFACKKLSNVHSFLAGPDEKKIRCLETLWRNPKIEKIMAVRGGAGSLRLIAGLEKEKFFKIAPKEIWGFSDLTSVQNYLFFKYGYSWVHSPMITSNALLDPTSAETSAWKSALSPKTKTTELELRPLSKISSARRSPLKGKIFGGNLSCLTSLAGGPWESRRSENRIIFLEEVNERDYRVDRVLTQLSNSQMFSSVEAVVLGHFTNCPKAEKIIAAWADRVGVQLFTGIKSGHDRPNWPISMGVSARLEISSQNTAFLELPTPSLR
jgi:muramoyltetrapeptide carboxypeptidase